MDHTQHAYRTFSRTHTTKQEQQWNPPVLWERWETLVSSLSTCRALHIVSYRPAVACCILGRTPTVNSNPKIFWLLNAISPFFVFLLPSWFIIYYLRNIWVSKFWKKKPSTYFSILLHKKSQFGSSGYTFCILIYNLNTGYC